MLQGVHSPLLPHPCSLELLGSSNSPASASRAPGTMVPGFRFIFITLMSSLSRSPSASPDWTHPRGLFRPHIFSYLVVIVVCVLPPPHTTTDYTPCLLLSRSPEPLSSSSAPENSRSPALFPRPPADSVVNTHAATPGNKWFPTFLSFSDAESRKLCKKMKVDLSPKDKKIELFHYQ